LTGPRQPQSASSVEEALVSGLSADGSTILTGATRPRLMLAGAAGGKGAATNLDERATKPRPRRFRGRCGRISLPAMKLRHAPAPPDPGRRLAALFGERGQLSTRVEPDGFRAMVRTPLQRRGAPVMAA
jgi:hypothetical protein